MELLAMIIAYALLIILAILGFKKLHTKLDHIDDLYIEFNGELARIRLLLKFASIREQNIKYNLARHTSKLERILKKVSK